MLCEKMPATVHTYFTKKDAKLHWFCSGCNSHAIQTLEMLGNVEKDNLSLRDSLCSLEQKFTEFETKFNTAENTRITYAATAQTPVAITGTMPKNTDPARPVDEEIREAIEIDKRKLNLIIRNMPISIAEDEDDITCFKKIAANLKVDVDIESCERFGQITVGKPLLLRLKLRSFKQKMDILRNSKDLMLTEEFKEIFISPDRTRRQQAADYALRQELRQLNSVSKDFYIVRGKITKKKSDNQT